MMRKILLFVIFITAIAGCVKSNLNMSLEEISKDRTVSDKEVLHRATKKIFSVYGGKYEYEIKKYDNDYTVNIIHNLGYPKTVKDEDPNIYREIILNKAAEIIFCYFKYFQDRKLLEVKYLIKQQIIKDGKRKIIDLCQVRASRDMLTDLHKMDEAAKSIEYIKRNWSIEVDSFYELNKLVD